MGRKNLNTWGAGDPNYAETMKKLKPVTKPMPIKQDNSYIDPVYSLNSGNGPIDRPVADFYKDKKTLKKISKAIKRQGR
jgi:hypothetical protein